MFQPSLLRCIDERTDEAESFEAELLTIHERNCQLGLDLGGVRCGLEILGADCNISGTNLLQVHKVDYPHVHE